MRGRRGGKEDGQLTIPSHARSEEKRKKKRKLMGGRRSLNTFGRAPPISKWYVLRREDRTTGRQEGIQEGGEAGRRQVPWWELPAQADASLALGNARVTEGIAGRLQELLDLKIQNRYIFKAQGLIRQSYITMARTVKEAHGHEDTGGSWVPRHVSTWELLLRLPEKRGMIDNRDNEGR